MYYFFDKNYEIVCMWPSKKIFNNITINRFKNILPINTYYNI